MPLTLEKSVFEVSIGNGVNTKVVGVNKINQTELKYEFFGIADNPHADAKSLKMNHKESH